MGVPCGTNQGQGGVLPKQTTLHFSHERGRKIGWLTSRENLRRYCLDGNFHQLKVTVHSTASLRFPPRFALLLCVCIYWIVQESCNDDNNGGGGGAAAVAVVGFTSRLARSTFGTMWGRQRPSINNTLSSLSAIRDTWKWEGRHALYAKWSQKHPSSFKMCRPLLPGGCRSTFGRRTAGLAGRPGTAFCNTTTEKGKGKRANNSHPALLHHSICTPQELWSLAWFSWHNPLRHKTSCCNIYRYVTLNRERAVSIKGFLAVASVHQHLCWLTGFCRWIFGTEYKKRYTGNTVLNLPDASLDVGALNILQHR